MQEIDTTGYISVRFKSYHEECEGTPLRTYSIFEANSGLMEIDPEAPCRDMDEKIDIDLTEVTIDSLQNDIVEIIDGQGDHSNDLAGLDVLIRSVYLVWDEDGKPDWDIFHHSDEDLKAVLVELKDSGFRGHFAVDWYY